MRKKVFLFSLWLALAVVGLAPPAAAQPPLETLDQRINGVVAPVSDAVAAFIFYSVPVAGANVRLIVVWLILAAVICGENIRTRPSRARCHTFRR
jgi:AGCS family alanine or glycine:cation symporter